MAKSGNKVRVQPGQNATVKDSKGNVLFESKGGNVTIGNATVVFDGSGMVVQPNKYHIDAEEIDTLGDILDY